MQRTCGFRPDWSDRPENTKKVRKTRHKYPPHEAKVEWISSCSRPLVDAFRSVVAILLIRVTWPSVTYRAKTVLLSAPEQHVRLPQHHPIRGNIKSIRGKYQAGEIISGWSYSFARYAYYSFLLTIIFFTIFYIFGGIIPYLVLLGEIFAIFFLFWNSAIECLDISDFSCFLCYSDIVCTSQGSKITFRKNIEGHQRRWNSGSGNGKECQ